MSKYLLDKESIGKLAIEVFGEDRVWIEQGEKEEENPDFDQDRYDEDENYDEPEFITIKSLDIYVHFPHLVIKNSEGAEHPIMDLFTRTRVQNIRPENDYKCDVYFQGRRTTYSLKEMYSGYTHSHLPGSEYGFYDFCTGSSYYNTLLYDLPLKPTEEAWLMLFMGMENFVSWESLEGGPYRKIREIGGMEEDVNDSKVQQELKKILPLLPKQVWTYTDKLKLIENHPLVYQVFNQYSSIRKLGKMSDERAQQYVKSYEDDYRSKKLIWKQKQEGEKEFPFKVIYESTGDSPQIAKEVVDKYVQIINRQVQEYNQNLSYERAKEKYYPVTIAKAGIIQ